MCGVIGYISSAKRDLIDDFEWGLNQLKRRGPDNQSYVIKTNPESTFPK